MGGLYRVKPWFVRRLRHIEDALVARRVTADALTFAAVGVSVCAGAAILFGGLLHRPELWMLVLPLVVVRLALNALDGSVARRTRTARPFGVALNEVGDRLSDAATLGATSFVAGPKLGLGAVACAFLASFAGVLALAVTGKRDAGGPAGKADRAMLLGIGAAAGALAGSAVPFTVVLWAIIGGSIVTVVARMGRMHSMLSRRPRLAEPTVVDLPGSSEIDEEMLDALVR